MMSENPNKLSGDATKEQIADALRTWGANGEYHGSEKALDFLEGLPFPTLQQVLPSLWRAEYTGPSETWELTHLQQGIVRFCCLHPSWQFVPLLIETLTVREDHPENLRPLLTDLLPLWCREPTARLGYEQRSILMNDLQIFLSRNVGFLRRTFAPENRVSDAEANYCLAILQTLRHEAMRNGVLKLDKEVVVASKRVARLVAPDDPNRDSVLEIAQLLLQESQT